MEQFEALLKCDIIDLKKLRNLAFNGKRQGNNADHSSFFHAGCPEENGIRSLTWKVPRSASIDRPCVIFPFARFSSIISFSIERNGSYICVNNGEDPLSPRSRMTVYYRRDLYRGYIRETIIKPGLAPTSELDFLDHVTSSFLSLLHTSKRVFSATQFCTRQFLGRVLQGERSAASDRQRRPVRFFLDSSAISHSLSLSRLCPDLSFFQRETDYPCAEIMHQEAGFESLRKRIVSTALKVESQSQSRLTGRLEFQSNHSLYHQSKKTTAASSTTYDDSEYQPLPDGHEAHWEVVERILFVFSKLNSGQSYVQGMNEIIGPIYYTFATDPNNEWRGTSLSLVETKPVFSRVSRARRSRCVLLLHQSHGSHSRQFHEDLRSFRVRHSRSHATISHASEEDRRRDLLHVRETETQARILRLSLADAASLAGVPFARRSSPVGLVVRRSGEKLRILALHLLGNDRVRSSFDAASDVRMHLI